MNKLIVADNGFFELKNENIYYKESRLNDHMFKEYVGVYVRKILHGCTNNKYFKSVKFRCK